jgi:hypothetical protein
VFIFKDTEPIPLQDPPGVELTHRTTWGECVLSVCVECLIGKQNKPTLFKVTEPRSVPYRTPPACAKWASYPDPPPVIPVPDTGAAQVQPPQVMVSWRTKTEMTEY